MVTGLGPGAYVYHKLENFNNGRRMLVLEIDTDKNEALCQLVDLTPEWISFDDIDLVTTEAPDGFTVDTKRKS